MNTDNIVPSEISQTQRTNTVEFPTVPVIGEFIKTRSRIMVAWVWGEGRMGNYCLMGTEFLFRMMSKFWKWIVAMVVQHCDYNVMSPFLPPSLPPYLPSFISFLPSFLPSFPQFIYLSLSESLWFKCISYKYHRVQSWFFFFIIQSGSCFFKKICFIYLYCYKFPCMFGLNSVKLFFLILKYMNMWVFHLII